MTLTMAPGLDRGQGALPNEFDSDRRVLRRVEAIWILLFLNVLSFIKMPTVIPVPSRIGQVLTQGALALAVVLTLSVNRRLVVRPNFLLALLSIMAVISLMTGVRVLKLGTDFRTVRLAVFVLLLWLLTPWWGRKDMLLLKAHLRALTWASVSVVVGFLLAHHKAMGAQHRLAGAIWPIPPPAVAHYAALLIGLTGVLWLCGLMSGRRALITLPVGLALILLSHTRTAILAAAIGLLVAAGSLFISRRRVRITVLAVVMVLTVSLPVFAPAVTSWMKRGEGSAQLTHLTGRTDTWHLVVSTPRPDLDKVIGSGVSNDSFDGLSIDSTWMATYYNQGIVGVVLVALMVLVVLAAAMLSDDPIPRAVALFLVVFCIISSYTETGLGSANPYMLDLVLAAAILAHPVSHRIRSLVGVPR